MKILKLDAILVNFAIFGDLITNEDLEETYRNLYFFESFLCIGYGENNEKAQNQVWRDFFLRVFFIASKILGPPSPPISGSEIYNYIYP